MIMSDRRKFQKTTSSCARLVHKYELDHSTVARELLHREFVNARRENLRIKKPRKPKQPKEQQEPSHDCHHRQQGWPPLASFGAT